MDRATLMLKKGLGKLAASGHPWIFDGALDPSGGLPDEPCLARVVDGGGRTVGVGTYNPRSTIAVRLFSREDVFVDEEFFRARFAAAADLRSALVASAGTDSFRLVNGEGDRLPGLVVDRFGEHLVVQVGTPGLAALGDAWLPALVATFSPASVIARPDQGAANRERFEPPIGALFGRAPESVVITENGVRFRVPLGGGQKTGFFFDQRENRRLVAALAAGRTVLDAYSYQGGFSVGALVAGAARAVAVDSSGGALDVALANAGINGVADRLETVRADCHEYLASGARDFELVVVDPPALAKRRKDLERAARAYKDAFLGGLRRVADGGFALLCSCSSAVDRRLFDQIVAAATRDAGRDARIVLRGGAGPDHPIDVAHPEGEYLKVVMLKMG